MAGVALLGIGGAIGSAVSGDTQPAPVVIAVSPSSAPGALHPTLSPRATSSAPAALTQDGTYLVGKDIQPGQYSAAHADANCYWAVTGKDGSVLENGIGARPIILITPNVDTFTSTGCGTWVKVK